MDLEDKRVLKERLVPLTGDLKALNTRLDNILRDYRHQFMTEVTEYDWGRFLRALLVKVFLFNKKRAAEPAKITVAQLVNPINWDTQTTQESLKQLTAFEQKLKEDLTLLLVRGKRRRLVPILLTKQMVADMKVLIEHREKFVSVHNPYVFAARNKSVKAVRSDAALREMLSDMEGELERPEAIRGTNLRKYLATIIQMFDLGEREVDWCARFLGHDIMVHREYYRQEESVLYTTKVARLLLAADEGKVEMYQGKKLDEIQVDEGYFGEADDCEKEEEDSGNGESCDEDGGNDGVDDRQPGLAGTKPGGKKRSRSASQGGAKKQRRGPAFHLESEPINFQPISTSAKLTTEEKNYFADYFKAKIKDKASQLPGKKLCLTAASDHSVQLLEKIEKNWTVVKNLIYARKQGLWGRNLNKSIP